MWIIGNLMQLEKAWWTNYFQPSSWTLNKPLTTDQTKQIFKELCWEYKSKKKKTLAKLQENKLNEM